MFMLLTFQIVGQNNKANQLSANFDNQRASENIQGNLLVLSTCHTTSLPLPCISLYDYIFQAELKAPLRLARFSAPQRGRRYR